MSKTITIFLLLTFFCVAVTPQTKQQIAKIEKSRNEMYKLVKNNQFSELANYYTDDAIVDGYDTKLNGLNEIKNYWQNLKGKGIDWKWETYGYSGNENYILQTGVSYLTLGYGSKDVTYSSLFAVAWEKQEVGTYKIALDFYRNAGQSKAHNYAIIKDSVYIKSGGNTIFGILFKPVLKEKKNIPAFLCLQGGGDVGLKNYFYEAEFFAKNGIAALVCDKAGAGLSKGPDFWVTQTFEQKVEEYGLLLEWLKKQSGIDPGKTGVHGLSEGGRLAIALAIKFPAKVAFVNSVSGPVQSFKDNQLFAIQNYLVNRNLGYSTVVKVLSLWDEYFDAIADKNIPGELIERVSKFRSKYPKLYLPGNSTDLPQRPRPEDINYTLKGKLDKIKCPVFLQFGEDDHVVNVKRAISLFPKSPEIKSTIYKDTNHSMLTENNLVQPKYLIDKLDWLLNSVLKQ